MTNSNFAGQEIFRSVWAVSIALYLANWGTLWGGPWGALGSGPTARVPVSPKRPHEPPRRRLGLAGWDIQTTKLLTGVTNYKIIHRVTSRGVTHWARSLFLACALHTLKRARSRSQKCTQKSTQKSTKKSAKKGLGTGLLFSPLFLALFWALLNTCFF